MFLLHTPAHIPCTPWFIAIHNFNAHTGSKGALTVGGLIFTNKSKDVQAFPVLFCPSNSSPVSVTSSPPPHLSVVGLSWWAQDEQSSLPCDLFSVFPSVFPIICPFLFQRSGVIFNHVLELRWWAAHMSVITCVDVMGWISQMFQWSASLTWGMTWESLISHHFWGFMSSLLNSSRVCCSSPAPCSQPSSSLFSHFVIFLPKALFSQQLCL